MSSPVAIKVENVSKAYTIWTSASARLHGPVLGQVGQLPFVPAGVRDWCRDHSQQSFRQFYALRDISFEVPRGESVGIIGRNGSGKSTLLQIIAGTLRPTTGQVTVTGSVAALLELGSGFNPEFTGRENVFMNAAIRGLSTAQTTAKFDEIAAFADIGDFIEQPTKTYSSGMLVRLAFAVSVCVEPELLIVDEALSVGDVFFQQKCFKRIHELLDRGTTLLFVSHDTGAVQNLCSRALLLKDGTTVFEGAPEEAVSRYYASASGTAKGGMLAGAGATTVCAAADWQQMRAEIVANNILGSARATHGRGEIQLMAASFLNEHGQHALSVRVLQTAKVYLLLRGAGEIPFPQAGIQIYDRMNNLVFGASSQQLRVKLAPLKPAEERIVMLQVTFAVQPGEYTFSLGCAEPSADGPNVGVVQHRHEGLGPLTVHASESETWPFYGIAGLPMKVSEWVSA